MKYFILTAVIFVAASFAACGGGGGGGGGVTYVPSATAPGVSGSVNPENPAGCSLGQVYSPSYGCLDQGSCAGNNGWSPSTNTCVPGTLITAAILSGTNGTGSYFGALTITNQTAFQKLLQYAGLCNPYWVGVNYGSWSCATWTNGGGFVQIQVLGGTTAQATNVTMVIGAGSVNSAQSPGWATLMPTAQSQSYIAWSTQATEVLYNNSAGMQIVSVYNGVNQEGAPRLIIPTGQFGQQTPMQGTLMYQNTQIATVTLTPIQ